MKAVKLYKPGEPDQLVIEDVPVPQPATNQVLIKVKAFGLNRSEFMTRKGWSPDVTFPRVLGIECAGEIALDPSGEFEKGQKVIAFMGEMGRQYDGSYAEFTVLPKSIVYPIDSDLPWEVLGAVPEMYQTVHGSLFEALDIQKGEIILIRGGTSSVGLLAAQIARDYGLTVISTTRNPNNKDILVRNGASHVLIDNGSIGESLKSICKNGVDKVLELVGANTLKDSLQCLRPGGTACMSGMLSETWSIKDFAPMEFIPATVRLTVYDSGQVRSSHEVFQNFIRQVQAGGFHLPVAKIFKLDQIVEAHQLMESNQAGGKIVVLT